MQLTFLLHPGGTLLFYYEHDSDHKFDIYDPYGLLLILFHASSWWSPFLMKRVFSQIAGISWKERKTREGNSNMKKYMSIQTFLYCRCRICNSHWLVVQVWVLSLPWPGIWLPPFSGIAPLLQQTSSPLLALLPSMHICPSLQHQLLPSSRQNLCVPGHLHLSRRSP